MKILFGINNDNTVKGIVSFYEEKYKEKLEYKIVYYYKNLLQEIEAVEYDRVVLLEELEKFPTDNTAQIDDYLFTNIDSITDLFDSKNLIYISSDRRKLGDDFLAKLFNLGIYSVLTEQDRTKGKVCEFIYKPMLKKDAKKYYEDRIAESVYKSVQVSEIELQRIISYFKNLNGIADKYNEIFDRICQQYTDEQLKVIINFLPVDVKQYLSFNNEKYKQVINAPEITVSLKPNNVVEETANNASNIEIKAEPEIIEKIIVKEKNKEAAVVTEVLEKQVYQSVYEVPKDYKKVVCFIGAPKTGTTFCINAIGTSLAKNKVKTAIVDMTRKRDLYNIYTYDNEGKRSIAAQSLKYASKGFDEPLAYEALSVYTAMPGEDRKSYNAGRVIETIMQNNQVVLIDADFTTPTDYFRLCQEIYIVQDMDTLNVAQITLFIRELKSRGLPMSKFRVIVNKHLKCSVTAKDILDGIATYTSYDLKTYDELFTSQSIPYFILPFNEENYKKYIDMLFKYTNTFSSFSDDFKSSISTIINSIYPLGNIYEKNLAQSHKQNKKKGLGIFNFKKPTDSYFMSETEGDFEKEVK